MQYSRKDVTKFQGDFQIGTATLRAVEINGEAREFHIQEESCEIRLSQRIRRHLEEANRYFWAEYLRMFAGIPTTVAH